MWIIAKITPAVNWPGLAYSIQQLLKTRGALAPCPPPPPPTLSYAHVITYLDDLHVVTNLNS